MWRTTQYTCFEYILHVCFKIIYLEASHTLKQLLLVHYIYLLVQSTKNIFNTKHTH